jgi:cytochrome P450
MEARRDGSAILVSTSHMSLYWMVLMISFNMSGYQVYVPYDTDGSLLDLLDNDAHSKRRKIWERALTPNAIKSYEPILQDRLAQFINGMTIRKGQTVDIAEWFGFFTLDFIGDLAFGGAFNFMNQGVDSLGIHNAIIQINITIETLGAIPWIRPLLQTLPFSQPKRWLKIAMDVAEKRKAGGSQIRDLFYYLVRYLRWNV